MGINMWGNIRLLGYFLVCITHPSRNGRSPYPEGKEMYDYSPPCGGPFIYIKRKLSSNLKGCPEFFGLYLMGKRVTPSSILITNHIVTTTGFGIITFNILYQDNLFITTFTLE
jgi:hypothetical protein